MQNQAPLPIFIAYSIGCLDDVELIAWAANYVPESEHFADDHDLLELLRLNPKQPGSAANAGKLLRAFVDRIWPGYDLSNPKAEHYAKRFFRNRLEQYLAGECSPWQVCRMIGPIEQLFDYPDWLGDLYNACDWIEPGVTSAQWPHLESVVRETLDEL